MNKKGAEIITSRIIVLVFVILVITLVLILIFKPDILSWIKGWPDYQNENNDVEVTPGVEGITCPEDLPKPLGTFLGDEKNGLMNVGGIQFEVKNKWIYVLLNDRINWLDPGYLSAGGQKKEAFAIGWLENGEIMISGEVTNLDSHFWRSNWRFFVVPRELWAEFFVNLYKAKIISGVICRSQQVNGIVEKGWPEKYGLQVKSWSLSELKPEKKTEENSILPEERYKIELPIKLNENSPAKIEFFYMEEDWCGASVQPAGGGGWKNLKCLLIKAAQQGGNLDIGAIYPDGSIWISPAPLLLQDRVVSGSYKWGFSLNYPTIDIQGNLINQEDAIDYYNYPGTLYPALETNLRISLDDYKKLVEFVEK